MVKVPCVFLWSAPCESARRRHVHESRKQSEVIGAAPLLVRPLGRFLDECIILNCATPPCEMTQEWPNICFSFQRCSVRWGVEAWFELGNSGSLQMLRRVL
jgi:hypothetical protein